MEGFAGPGKRQRDEFQAFLQFPRPLWEEGDLSVPAPLPQGVIEESLGGLVAGDPLGAERRLHLVWFAVGGHVISRQLFGFSWVVKQRTSAWIPGLTNTIGAYAPTSARC